MNKFDVIVSWPRNADYPVWRQMIRDLRQKFNNVIVVFTETNQGDDYREFVREAMKDDYILFADSPQVPDRDWRDVAVNHGLLQSYNSEWVWFTEQDFFPDEPFWKKVDAFASAGMQAIGVKQGDRLHPCSLFIRRDLLNELKKDFGIKSGVYDHFGSIQKQLEEKKIPIGIIPQPNNWGHLNGLSQNMNLAFNGQMPNYEPDIFNYYLKNCLAVPVPMDSRFKHNVLAYFRRAGISLGL